MLAAIDADFENITQKCAGRGGARSAVAHEEALARETEWMRLVRKRKCDIIAADIPLDDGCPPCADALKGVIKENVASFTTFCAVKFTHITSLCAVLDARISAVTSKVRSFSSTAPTPPTPPPHFKAYAQLLTAEQSLRDCLEVTAQYTEVFEGRVNELSKKRNKK